MPTLMGRPHVFEREDRIYLTTPLLLAQPDAQRIEEMAFASAVRSTAPNENIGWLEGRYVEAGRPNLNNAMWLSDELALKSLTPMLMPVTVMHDPRTAVGTIADCKLIGADQPSSRIDTVLAIWRHRFSEVWDEAAANIAHGELMQSMECYAPDYSCSDCGQQYVKLPGGAEKASWCDHLRTGDSRRILSSVCFTGTGLIFGSRGGVGAYTEAYLDHFRDEIAEYHDRAHHDETYRPRSTTQMALVQIEETELATLRRERDEAKAKSDQLQTDNRDLTVKVEQAEAAKVAAETAKSTAETELKAAKDETAASKLKDTRMGALGAGFLAKLGDTTKTVLAELAGKASDEEWELALKEREEMASKLAGSEIKRDLAADATTPPAGGGGGVTTPPAPGSSFANEEVASFMRQGVGATATGDSVPDGASSVRQLARSFGKPKAPAGAAK